MAVLTACCTRKPENISSTYIFCIGMKYSWHFTISWEYCVKLYFRLWKRKHFNENMKINLSGKWLDKRYEIRYDSDFLWITSVIISLLNVYLILIWSLVNLKGLSEVEINLLTGALVLAVHCVVCSVQCAAWTVAVVWRYDHCPRDLVFTSYYCSRAAIVSATKVACLFAG